MAKGQVQPRNVAVAIPYSVSDGKEGKKKIVLVCLVSSRKHEDKFVLPKGGVEEGESSRQAAIRELWEEAGLKPIGGQEDIGRGATNKVADHKPHKKSPSTTLSNVNEEEEATQFTPRAIYGAHEIQVQKDDPSSELADWPEKEERERRWATVEEALELIRWRKDIHHLLSQSSLV